jgi:hypothetical protein
MDVGELVEAALVGFDRKEGINIPPLPDEGRWEAFNTARLGYATKLTPNTSRPLSRLTHHVYPRHLCSHHWLFCRASPQSRAGYHMSRLTLR